MKMGAGKDYEPQARCMSGNVGESFYDFMETSQVKGTCESLNHQYEYKIAVRLGSILLLLGS